MIDAEPFLDGALATLRREDEHGLASHLDAISDALGLTGPDRIPRPPPDNYWLGVVARPLQYPIVEIAIPDWNMTGFDLGQLGATADFSMIVSATLRDPGEAGLHSDRLYRMTLRYVRALLNCLLEPDAVGPGAVVSSVRGAYRMNPQSREGQEVISAAAIAFTLESGEEREPAV